MGMRKLTLFVVGSAVVLMGTKPMEMAVPAGNVPELIEAEEDIIYEAELASYVNWFLQHYPRRAKIAKGYIPTILDESKKYAIDPLLIGIIITFESSWMQKAEGSKYEKGLMQIMPRSRARKLFDVSTPEGSIRAGVHVFNTCLNMCKGNLLRSLSAYQSGSCRVLKSAKLRLKTYKKAIRMHGIFDRELE